MGTANTKLLSNFKNHIEHPEWRWSLAWLTPNGSFHHQCWRHSFANRLNIWTESLAWQSSKVLFLSLRSKDYCRRASFPSWLFCISIFWPVLRRHSFIGCFCNVAIRQRFSILLDLSFGIVHSLMPAICNVFRDVLHGIKEIKPPGCSSD